MRAVIKVKVGDEFAGGISVPNFEDSPWLAISAAPLSIVDVTSLPVIPAEGSVWDGELFDTPSTRAPLAGHISLAFIVDGKCAHVMPLSPQFNPALIAAFRSGATFEVVLDPPADFTYDPA
jgi:hypothetical protein